MGMNKVARGERNNNPGNIRWGKSKWIGMVPRSEATDDDLCQFKKPEYGIRAIVIVLRNYHRLHRIKNIRGAIFRWAPPNENDTGEYIRRVVVMTGFDELQELDFHDRNVMVPLVKAIITVELGYQPYPDALILRGFEMAYGGSA